MRIPIEGLNHQDGCLLLSHTSMRTLLSTRCQMTSDTLNLLQAGTYSLEASQNIGVELLRGTLQDAFIFYTSSPIAFMQQREVMDSVLFIRGSGLEATIETFGMKLDADILRETFEEWCIYYKRKWQSR